MNQTIKLAREATYFLPLMLLAVVLGFWPSYFAALGSIRVSLHVHGLLMFAWMVGLVGQGILIQTGQRKWHRRVGRMSFAVAPAMVVTGLFVTREFIGRAGSNPDRLALEVFTISVLSIFAFGLLFGLAIAYRRQPQLHARARRRVDPDSVLARHAVASARLGLVAKRSRMDGARRISTTLCGFARRRHLATRLM